MVKFVFVGLMLVISGYHDFVLGPKIVELMRLVPRGERPPVPTMVARRRLIVLTRLNLSFAITVAVLGLMLVRGVPG